MALRTIREIGDPILEKECKPLKTVTDRTIDLINDMFETMYAANGVGLAAPQVGILRQLFVIDIGDGQRYICINPTVTPIGDETQTVELIAEEPTPDENTETTQPTETPAEPQNAPQPVELTDKAG